MFSRRRIVAMVDYRRIGALVRLGTPSAGACAEPPNYGLTRDAWL